MGKAGKRKKKYWILGFLLAVSMGMGCAGAESSKDAAEGGKQPQTAGEERQDTGETEEEGPESRAGENGRGEEGEQQEDSAEGNGQEEGLGSRIAKGGETEEDGNGNGGTPLFGNAFAYMDSADCLYLWQEGSEEPVLLTDEYVTFTTDSMGPESAENSDMDVWNWVSYAPDKKEIYFPSHIKVRQFEGSGAAVVYDLYGYTDEGRTRLLARDIAAYRLDGDGGLWFSKAADQDGMVLYRLEGEELEEIGEMGAPAEAEFRISADGSYVVFQGKDGGLYGKAQGETARKLAEKAEGKFFLSADKSRCVYRDGNRIGIVSTQGQGIDGTVETDNGGKVYVLDENAEYVLVVEEEKVTYDKVLENDMGKEGAAGQLWELFGEAEAEYYIRKGKLHLYDAEAGRAEVLAEGYLMDSMEYDQMEPFRGFYYFEMIAGDGKQKIAASDYCAPYSAEEVLESYGYQGKTALEGNELYWYEQAQGYLIHDGKLEVLEGIELSGQSEVRRTYNKQDKKFYVRIIRAVPRYEGKLNFMDAAAGGGEDVYEFDEDGNYRKVAEGVQQALVIGDNLYYLRNAASGRFQRLYCLDSEEYLAQADAINLDQMRKMEKTGELFYLTGSYGIYSLLPGDLNCYDGTGNKRIAEQIYQFRLYGEDCVAALQNTFDPDSDEYYEMVIEGSGDLWSSNPWGRLLVFENGRKKTLAEEALFLMKIQE